MLRALPQTRYHGLALRLTAIGIMTLVTVLSARISIPLDPVPFTLQPLAVLLAGLILGARDGALSQLAYVALIAANLPVDANLRGQAALFGPTGGYLIGFVLAALLTGWIAERGRTLALRFSAGIVGIAVIYACGLIVLMAVRALDFSTAWAAGAAPFLMPDLAKALIAASLAEGGRALLLRAGRGPLAG
ncbi:MAG: biotin transporter BioY [Candidatus Flexifilum sp.]|jgi:biotin transport system substrate-specific component